MTNRIKASILGLPLIFSAALAFGVAAGWQLRGHSAVADEHAASLAETELDRFFQALSGNGTLGDVLGEAFQLIRTDGRRYDRTAYLAGASSLTGYAVDDVEAVEADGILTATFLVNAAGKIGDVHRDTVGQPRLAVFSKVDGAWKLQAYANLGQGVASGIDEEAKTAVKTWVDTVAGGDVDAIGDLLAPEFQLVRSNGAAYDAVEFVARDIPKIDAVLGIADIVATGYGDHMVVRYALDLSESVVADGRIVGTAPRLTVFRRQGDKWLVVAHANFAQVEK